jgi:linoleoyl-CoA desaturase
MLVLNPLPLKDKHLHIPEDLLLLKAIHQAVDVGLKFHKDRIWAALLGKFVVYAVLSLTAYAMLYRLENSLLFILCFVAYGFLILLFAFNFAHDFSHGTIFRRARWDNLGFIALYTLNGAHAEAWKRRHLESHHFAPNVEYYDSDLEISSLIRVIPNSQRSWFHSYQHLYAPVAYMTYSLYWVFIKDFYIFWKDKPVRTGYAISFAIQKCFYITYLFVLPLLFSQQAWYIVAAGFLLMHLMQSLFLLFTFFMTHHVEGLEYPTTDDDGYIRTSWVMNQIRSSNDMYPFSGLANFIFGGFNNHIAHHLFPQVHHIHYPALNRILYSTLEGHGILPSQTTYWGGICSHLRLLRRMGKA